MLIGKEWKETERVLKREPERTMIYYYGTVTNEQSNLVIFTNQIFFSYILHKDKIQHYVIVFGGSKQNYCSQYKDTNF